MRRSLLVQALLDMATGSGGAKLEELVVDAAGTFDAGSGKGYNPVTVPSGSINVLGEKGVVSNNSVVVTPKVQVVGGWLNSGETSGSGVGVTASELVSGTLNVSSDGVQDVTNYQNISVPSAGHSASASKSAVLDHSITVTPRSTATQGFVQAGTVDGSPVSVAASELVSGNQNITANGDYDVTNLASVNVSVESTLSRKVEYGVTGGGTNILSIVSSDLNLNNIQLITIMVASTSSGMSSDAIRAAVWTNVDLINYCCNSSSRSWITVVQDGITIRVTATTTNFVFQYGATYAIIVYE